MIDTKEANNAFKKRLYKQKLMECRFRCGICNKNMRNPQLLPFIEHNNTMFNENNYNLFHEECVNPYLYLHYMLEKYGEISVMDLILASQKTNHRYSHQFLNSIIKSDWVSDFEF